MKSLIETAAFAFLKKGQRLTVTRDCFLWQPTRHFTTRKCWCQVPLLIGASWISRDQVGFQISRRPWFTLHHRPVDLKRFRDWRANSCDGSAQNGFSRDKTVPNLLTRSK